MSKNFNGLKFGADGKFKIMAIGDVHEKINADAKTEDTMNLLEKAAAELKPDVAIFMGDIVSGNNHDAGRLATPEEILEAYVRITEPFVKRGIPFGITFGNHDGQTGETKDVLYKLLDTIPGFINTDDSGATGVGNCYVPISSGNGKKQVFNLWLIDSGDGAQDGGSGYAWVDESQIKWYENCSNALKKANGGEPVPSIVFQHIPVCEEYLLLKETNILNPYRVRGHGYLSNRFYVKADNCTGYLGEGPCVPAKNKGQFKSWKKQGDVIGAFFGHDHQNDFVGTVEGIVLGQTKCSGFHIYGDGLAQGVRVLTLSEADPWSFDTEMVRYRDFFGTSCNSIKGYNLLTDRWHTNFKATLGVLGAAAGVAVIGGGIHAVKKLVKNNFTQGS